MQKYLIKNQKKDETEFHISIFSENETEMREKAAKVSAILGEEIEAEREIRCGECRDTFDPDGFAQHKDFEHDMQIEFCPNCGAKTDWDVLDTQGVCDKCFRKSQKEIGKPKPEVRSFFTFLDGQGHVLWTTTDIPKVERFRNGVKIQ